jgi:hypothetical protein
MYASDIILNSSEVKAAIVNAILNHKLSYQKICNKLKWDIGVARNFETWLNTSEPTSGKMKLEKRIYHRHIKEMCKEVGIKLKIAIVTVKDFVPDKSVSKYSKDSKYSIHG